MTRSSTLPHISPDGRFMIRIEETQDDRGSMHVDTRLIECATQRDLAWIGNEVDAGFLPEGMMRVTDPEWNAQKELHAVPSPAQRGKVPQADGGALALGGTRRFRLT